MKTSILKFPEKLRVLRLRRRLSQRALAHILGCTHTHVQNLEGGRSIPSADIVVRMARFFDVSTDDLLLDELDMRHEEQVVV